MGREVPIRGCMRSVVETGALLYDADVARDYQEREAPDAK